MSSERNKNDDAPHSLQELHTRLTMSLNQSNSPQWPFLKELQHQVLELVKKRDLACVRWNAAESEGKPAEVLMAESSAIASIDREMKKIHANLLSCGGYTYSRYRKVYSREFATGYHERRDFYTCLEWLSQPCNAPDELLSRWKSLLQPIVLHPNLFRAHYHEESFQLELAEVLHMFFGCVGHYYRIEHIMRRISPKLDRIDYTHRGGCLNCRETVHELESRDLQECVNEIVKWEIHIKNNIPSFMQVLDEAVKSKYAAAKDQKKQALQRKVKAQKARVYAQIRKNRKGKSESVLSEERSNKIHEVEQQYHDADDYNDPDRYSVCLNDDHFRQQSKQLWEEVERAIGAAAAWGETHKAKENRCDVENAEPVATGRRFEFLDLFSGFGASRQNSDYTKYYCPSAMWNLSSFMRPKTRSRCLFAKLVQFLHNKEAQQQLAPNGSPTVVSMNASDMQRSADPVFSPFERLDLYASFSTGYFDERKFTELKLAGLYCIRGKSSLRLFREGDVFEALVEKNNSNKRAAPTDSVDDRFKRVTEVQTTIENQGVCVSMHAAV